jgi:hypothetical protein
VKEVVTWDRRLAKEGAPGAVSSEVSSNLGLLHEARTDFTLRAGYNTHRTDETASCREP